MVTNFELRLLAGEERLEVVEDGERLQRGEVVDVEVEKAVADLAQQGVVELEET